MADKLKRTELQVGVFVFIGMIILIVFVLMIGDFRLINPGYTFKISFSFANGVKVSAPVRLAGVEVGEVKSLNIGYDEQAKKPQVLISVWVKKNAKIPIDSRVWVNMLGVLGEKYIEIIPGQNFKALLTEGSIIKGEDPISIQELTDLSRQVAMQVGDTVAKLSETLDSLNLIFDNIKQGQGTVGKLFFDNSLYDNIDEMFADLKKNPWKLLYRSKEK
ncbi:MAG: MlaD family protein [Candidatus Omnitrophica bacterium]|nr:MlaD family protein [Candidatus Omnitrophota bacterium]MDD5351931.1 MlaD family protein [Candidatus Omnitrophota bacterium]MDD5550757.1 MlaD family protein [Candidatus Omnitrophota bacterium]